MEGLRTQPDLHDLLQMEDDVLCPKIAVSPERSLQHSLNSSASKINTPAKVLMVGEPVLVKTELIEEHHEDGFPGDHFAIATTNAREELADGINTPSPETAAAMESLIADDDLTASSLKLGAMPLTPVNFSATADASKMVVRPQTTIMSTAKTAQQPISIAGKRFMVATQPMQVVRREGAGGPIVTKFLVKRTATAAAATQKSPIVFTKGKGLALSPAKSNSLKSGNILLSPIKGGFKIPISPIKSPIKVSVMPTLGKPITVPISMPQLHQKVSVNTGGTNSIRMLNGGLVGQAGKNFIGQQQISVHNSQVTNSVQAQVNNRQGQVLQQLQVIPGTTSIQDSQAAKIQYVQLLPPANNIQQPTIRSNQGQPITFTSMAQLNGGGLSLNQQGGTIAFLQQGLQKIHHLQPSSTQRKAHAVRVKVPGQQLTQQVKSQRLIMPATPVVHPPSSTLVPITPGSAISTGNIGYAMVPARYVEELTKHINIQNTFSQDATIQPLPKSHSGKIGASGKSKKPCNCTKSQCLKLYCECFANGQFCDDCNCVNCFNNLEHEVERSKSVKQCLERNPAAFRPKIGRGKDDSRTHQKGCNCKRSGCLKNYCECYEARIPCTSKCKCIGCKNYEDAGDRRSLMSLADAAEVRVQQQTAAKIKLSNQIGEIRPTARTTLSGERLPFTFFTQEVIEATCTCLLAQAEEAEKTNRPMAVAEAMILEEFGRCVMQIIQSAGKAKGVHFH